jgi:tetratricopeptide (TPR) repeat protein
MADMRWIQVLLGLATAAGVWAERGAYSAPGRLAGEAEDRLESARPGAETEAAALFRRALALDPASPFRWCDLGETEATAGRRREAEYCFRKAVGLGPNVPPVLMRAANFHLVSGEPARALDETNQILTLVRDYDDAVFGAWRRLGVPVPDILKRGLPPQASVRAAYFANAITNGTPEEVASVWESLEREGQAADAAAVDYTGFLLAHHAYAEAAATWHRHFGRRDPDYLAPNRVFNGGFERDPLGGGLDWKIDPVEGVAAGRDAREKHSGAASLRLSFDGTANLAYRHVAERVVVCGGRYRFSAFVKASGLTTDQGVRFRLGDAEARLDAHTRQIGGATEWERTALEIDLPTGPHLVEIELVREPSLKLDNRIGGTVWIDDVELSRTSANSRAAGNW